MVASRRADFVADQAKVGLHSHCALLAPPSDVDDGLRRPRVGTDQQVFPPNLNDADGGTIVQCLALEDGLPVVLVALDDLVVGGG